MSITYLEAIREAQAKLLREDERVFIYGQDVGGVFGGAFKATKGLAKELQIHHFSTDELLIANTNLQLGTRYFKHMVDHYDGQVEYALAAYNAGEGRVSRLLKQRDATTFASIASALPSETRMYVPKVRSDSPALRRVCANVPGSLLSPCEHLCH